MFTEIEILNKPTYIHVQNSGDDVHAFVNPVNC
jgi:hypothetical protein